MDQTTATTEVNAKAETPKTPKTRKPRRIEKIAIQVMDPSTKVFKDFPATEPTLTTAEAQTYLATHANAGTYRIIGIKAEVVVASETVKKNTLVVK